MKVRKWWWSLVVVAVWLLGGSEAQDLSIYGIFDSYLNPITVRQKNVIYSRCVQGLGLITCKPVLADDDIVQSYYNPYYRDLATIAGSNYCLQCCGSSPEYIDDWNLECPVDLGSRNLVNLYGYELRLARFQYEGDTEVIKCPLRRTACKYDSLGNTLSCDRGNDLTYLIGYTVRINVEKYDSNFKYWRGVTSCSIESIESDTPMTNGQNFHERIIMTYTPLTQPSIDNLKILIVLTTLLFIGFAALYFCRRKRCPYCQNKLVVSMNMCITCKLVGAKLPDPVLIQALESKGEHLQGEIPERFPYAKRIVVFLRLMIIIFLPCWARRKVRVQPVSVYKLDEQGKTTFIIPDVEEAKVTSDVLVVLPKNPEDEEDDEEEKGEETPADKNKNKKQLRYDRYQKRLEKSRLKEMKNNPNIINFPPELVYKAINHPKFMK